MIEAQQFRRKPIEVEAVQLTAANLEAVCDWIMDHDDACDVGVGATTLGPDAHIEIDTPRRTMRGDIGDWIIFERRDALGEFYPCKPDIFAATYEPAISDRERAVLENPALMARLRKGIEQIERGETVSYPAGHFERLAAELGPDEDERSSAWANAKRIALSEWAKGSSDTTQMLIAFSRALDSVLASNCRLREAVFWANALVDHPAARETPYRLQPFQRRRLVNALAALHPEDLNPQDRPGAQLGDE